MQPITDDEILSLWRTVRPSVKQNHAMVYQDGPYDVETPTFELRRLIELAMEQSQNAAVKGGGTPYPVRACSPSPWRRMTPEEYARDFASFPPHSAEVTMAISSSPSPNPLKNC